VAAVAATITRRHRRQATATLKSIVVSAPSTTIPIGTNQTMVATGTYSDGSTKVLNAASGLAWSTKSGGATVAQAFSSGIVTGKSVGTETINATQDSIVGSLAVTITVAVDPGLGRRLPDHRPQGRWQLV
jgi:hypothetical protein